MEVSAFRRNSLSVNRHWQSYDGGVDPETLTAPGQRSTLSSLSCNECAREYSYCMTYSMLTASWDGAVLNEGQLGA